MSVPAGVTSAKDQGLVRRLRRRLRIALRRCLPDQGALSLVVGISGGADSSALLHLLAQSAAERSYRLEAAYFDHEIRSAAERAEELKAVQRIADSAGVPLHLAGAPVRKHAREGRRSLEEQARIERYQFLRDVASATGAAAVAVGHTADDQAETILLHMLRGSGLRGLAGMMESQSWPFGDGPMLIRPLLSIRRKETAAFCMACGIVAHRDSENESARYQRNNVRFKLLPVMEEINPRAVEAIARLGDAAREQIQLLEEIRHTTSESVNLNVRELMAMPAALRSDALGAAFARLTGSRRGLTSKHVVAMNELLEANGQHRLNLPGVIEAVRDAEALRLRRTTRVEIADTGPSLPLGVPGRIRFADWEIATQLVPVSTSIQAQPTSAVIAADEASKGLTVRSWRPGDSIQPAGMAGHKKLQDLFVDRKIPRSARARVPVVCAGGEPLWAVGIRADARARCADPRTERVLITARKLDG